MLYTTADIADRLFISVHCRQVEQVYNKFAS